MNIRTYPYRIIFAALVIGLGVWWMSGKKDIFDDPYSTVIFGSDHNLIGAHIANDGQWRFPLIDSLPPHFVDAITTYEDKRFMSHLGVDPVAIGRALIVNIKANKITSGASTLTMQTVRLSRKGKPRSMTQKIIEAALAVRLETYLSKDEILKLYATHAPFGGNVVGLETASWRYFQKSPHNLSLSESAMLAVLPNAPSLIHINKNRGALLLKRNVLLQTMLEQAKIDSVEYQLALLETIPPAPHPLPRLAPHLLDYVIANGGEKAKHTTTLDIDIHNMVSDVVDFHHEEYSQSGIENIGAIVLDTWTGEVLSYLGNAPNATEEKSVDMVQAPRSSGSVLKPFLYALMLEEGLLAPDMLVQDIPTQIAGFRPRNYNRTYSGVIPASKALSQSLNVPAVKMLQEYRTDRFLLKLRDIGFTTLNKSADHYGLSLILGGGEVTLLELAGAYASLGRRIHRFTSDMSRYNNQDFMPPSLYKTEPMPSNAYRSEILSAGSIYHAFQAMEEVKRPAGEGEWRSFSSQHKVAWKTGTSYGHRDAWAVGITERYTVAVWVGNADGEGVAGLVGVKKAAPVLFDIFNRLPNDKYFDPPFDDLQSVNVCKHSGHLASQYCEVIDTLLVAQGVTESEVCPYHDLIHTDSKGQRVYKGCTSQEVESKPWFVLPPVVEFYYRKQHPEYLPLPLYNEDCEVFDGGHSPVAFIYPDVGSKIYVPKNIRGHAENIIARATHKDNEGKLYWHLDNQYLGETLEIHSMDLAVETGTHRLTIVDQNGNEASRFFEVIGE